MAAMSDAIIRLLEVPHHRCGRIRSTQRGLVLQSPGHISAANDAQEHVDALIAALDDEDVDIYTRACGAHRVYAEFMFLNRISTCWISLFYYSKSRTQANEPRPGHSGLNHRPRYYDLRVVIRKSK